MLAQHDVDSILHESQVYAESCGSDHVRILVTGASGFVMSYVLHLAARGGAEVVAVDNAEPHSATFARLGTDVSKVSWLRGDVTDRFAMERLLIRVAPDVIIHGAALTPSQEEDRIDPARTFDTNAGGTLNMLEAARLGSVGTFVLLSSTVLYGARPSIPAVDEEEPVSPNSGYAIAKLASEHLVAHFAAHTGLRGLVARVATAYGPWERMSATRLQVSSVRRVVDAALEGRTLRVAGASVARDYVHVEDVAQAVWLLASTEGVAGGLYNVGPDRAAPLAEALDALADVASGFSWRAVADDAQADLRQDPSQSRAGLDIGRISSAIPWRPRYDLASGAVATFRSFAGQGPM